MCFYSIFSIFHKRITWTSRTRVHHAFFIDIVFDSLPLEKKLHFRRLRFNLNARVLIVQPQGAIIARLSRRAHLCISTFLIFRRRRRCAFDEIHVSRTPPPCSRVHVSAIPYASASTTFKIRAWSASTISAAASAPPPHSMFPSRKLLYLTPMTR